MNVAGASAPDDAASPAAVPVAPETEATLQAIARAMADPAVDEGTRALLARARETLRGMDAAMKLYERTGFHRLPGPMGATGHGGCNAFYLLDL